MKHNSDLKNLSLQLYGKEVEITLVENSATQKLYNTNALNGTLVGRLWGDKKLIHDRHEDTVIAIMLRQGDKDIEIPCKDIDLLK
jgi:hypothetical protein